MPKLDKETGLKIMIKTVSGETHPYYKRVVDLADKYLKLITGENIEDLLLQFNPRESDEMFEQRKRITKAIVGAVSGKVKAPFEKVARSNNVTKKLVFSGDDNDANLKKLETSLDDYWGDETLDDYMEDRVLDLSFSDPNSFIVTEMTEKEGEKRIFPFEVSSAEAVNYLIDNNELVYLVVRKGEHKWTLYTDEYIAVFVELKKDKNKTAPGVLVSSLEEASTMQGESNIKIGATTYNVWVIENICQEIPAIRVGYNRDEMTKGNTFKSPMDAAVPRLEKMIKSDSELDLVISLHAFPQKLQYAQRCQGDKKSGDICEYGKIRGKDYSCKVCKGTGFVFHTSAASALTYEMPPQDELNSGTQLPDLEKLIAYKHPPIDIIKFENEYTRQLEESVLTDIFVSATFQKIVGPQTATEIEYDMQNVYDTLYPFARKFSSIYKKQVRMTAAYDGIKGIKVVHKFPKDFKLKSVTQLLGELEKANTANAPEFFKKQIITDIADKVYHDDPTTLKKFKVKQQHMPFPGKSEEQIKDIITSGRSTKEKITLWIEFENILQALEDEQFESDSEEIVSFYDLPYYTRKELINKKLQEVILAKANENQVVPLSFPETEDPEIV